MKDKPLFQEALTALKALTGLRRESFDNAKRLINLILDRHTNFIFYLGTGCSFHVGLRHPQEGCSRKAVTWMELLDALISQAPGDKQAEFFRDIRRRTRDENLQVLEDCYKHFDKLHVAWHISNCFPTADKRNRAIADIVNVAPEEVRTSKLYDVLLRLPFGDIVTTNYDSNTAYFLERAKEREDCPLTRDYAEVFDEVSLKTSFNDPNSLRLIYLHGKAGPPGAAPASRLVLDRFDYAELLAKRDKLFDYVAYLMRASHTLYVGFGLDDPSFNVMESRLFDLDRSMRPESFALVERALPDEFQKWEERNLHLIEYGDHDLLPQFLANILTIVRFFRWAEPDRPKRAGYIDEKRTRAYFQAAVRSYVEGRFEESLSKARAALASTLFWHLRKDKDDPDRYAVIETLDPRFAALICDIRIRMAICHYKLRSTREAKKHHARMHVNLDAANAIIKGQALEVQKNEMFIPLQCSVAIQQARDVYHACGFDVAHYQYLEIVADIKPIERREDNALQLLGYRREMSSGATLQQRELSDEGMDIDKALSMLKGIETHYYAQCQVSRIKYQLPSDGGHGNNDHATSRFAECGDMEKVSETIKKFQKDLNKAREPFKDGDYGAEFEYFVNSTYMIHLIARWTAGRHAVGTIRDVLPLPQENSARAELCEITTGHVNMIDKGVELLTPKEHPEFQWRQSARWQAFRYRYLARGYGLRWLIKRNVDPGSYESSDLDLHLAYHYLQKAITLGEGPAMERQDVLNKLEAARLNILAVYGEILENQSISPLSWAAGVYYLESAIKKMDILSKRAQDSGHRSRSEWLMALGLRLASYLALFEEPKRLLASLRGRVDVHPGTKVLRDFFAEPDETERKNRVIQLYQDCGLRLGDSKRMRHRIKLYKEAYETVARFMKTQKLSSRERRNDPDHVRRTATQVDATWKK